MANNRSALNVIHLVTWFLLSGAAFSQVSASSSEAQKPPKELGFIDKWRYESCLQEAAKAPTERGVFLGMKICRDKFGQ